jgi:hypothetical protein
LNLSWKGRKEIHLSGNPDLNRGPQVPQTCTLNQLRYCPTLCLLHIHNNNGFYSQCQELSRVVKMCYNYIQDIELC